MYAHRTIETIKDLLVQIDLPAEFADCRQAEIIVLPIPSNAADQVTWETQVLSLAGTLSDDFPDDIDDSDLGVDVPCKDLD
jgi:hypothetical protein